MACRSERGYLPRGRARCPARREPLRVCHYTSARNCRDIARDCIILPGSRGTDGPGVYVTDLAPGPDRLRIAQKVWNQWRPQSMEAYLEMPFIAGEMEPSARYPHVWVARRASCV